MTLAGAAQAGVATVEAEAESGVVGAGGAGETGGAGSGAGEAVSVGTAGAGTAALAEAAGLVAAVGDSLARAFSRFKRRCRRFRCSSLLYCLPIWVFTSRCASVCLSGV